MSVSKDTAYSPADPAAGARHPDPERLSRHDSIFRRLMEMDASAMIRRIRTAPMAELPAEVLARTYHHLWQEGRTEPAVAAVTRLFGGGPGDPPRGVGEPEYMRWLLILCERRVPVRSRWRDAEDLYQSTLRQILHKLRGPSGATAHTAWKAFCGDRLIDALRERTRKEPREVGLEVEHRVTGEMVSYADTAEALPWHGSVEADREELATTYMRARLDEVQDVRIREIGLDQFFGDPSPIDTRDPTDSRVPLTERYGLDRFQVYRLKRKAHSVLRRAYDEWLDMQSRP